MLLSKLTNLFGTRTVIKSNISYRSLFSRCNQFLNKPHIIKNVNRKKSLFLLFSKRSVEELKLADNVPAEYTLIYRNTMTKYFYLSQIVVFFTTSILCILYISNDSISGINQRRNTDATISWTDGARRTENELFYYFTAFAVILVVFQTIIGQLPVRIYRIPTESKYIFLFHRKVPIGLGMKAIYCKAGDLMRIDSSSSILPWKYNTFLMNGSKQVILYNNYFRRPADFNILLGEQEDTDE